MKIRTSWIIWAAIAIVLFFLGRGCAGDRAGTNQKTVDSLVIDHGLKAAWFNYYVDSVSRETLAKDQRIKELDRQRDSLRDASRKSAQNTSYWVSQYKAAAQKRDTVTKLAACDSLVDKIQITYAALERERQASDSLITAQQLRIELSAEILDKHRSRISEQDSVISKLYKAATDANNAVKKVDRKRRWGKIWAGVRTVAVGAAGFIVGQQLK
jgi:hypothetical protein